jgi:release factor glutamine methyltransferase
MTMMTINELVHGARDRFVNAGISANLATLDAEVLARQVLGWDRAQFLADRNEKATSAFLLRYEPLVARRERREPVSYILGTREFWGLPFEVGPDVLIPRQETEFIVEEAIELVGKDSHPRIVDVGTGSGCIGIALAREIPAARVIATDLSKHALEVARRNAVRHNVDDRMTFVETSFLEGIEGGVDLIVSNPPYVPSVSRRGLTPEVRDYEPPVALFGGEDGLDGLRSVLEGAVAKLATGGWLVMEFGCGQDDCVTELVRGVEGLDVMKIRHDLQDIPRTVICRRTSHE